MLRQERHRLRALAGVLLACLVTACSTLPPRARFPDLGVLDDEACLATLAARTSTIATMYAELTIVYEGPELDGAFDAVVHYRKPGALRITAFKDLIFAFESIFDLTLTPAAYSLSMVEEDGAPPTVARGTTGFPEDHPRFAEFYWAREAFCVPGITSADTARMTRDAGVLVITGRLSSGATVTWYARERTLEVYGGTVHTPDGVEVVLEYSDYRFLDGVFLPGRVIFRNPTGATTLDSRLEHLEVDPLLDDEIFECGA